MREPVGKLDTQILFCTNILVLKILPLISGYVNSNTLPVEYLGLTSQQHVRSYQDGYWLVIVPSHGEFIVLCQWEPKSASLYRDNLTVASVTNNKKEFDNQNDDSFSSKIAVSFSFWSKWHMSGLRLNPPYIYIPEPSTFTRTGVRGWKRYRFSQISKGSFKVNETSDIHLLYLQCGVWEKKKCV